MPMVVTINRPDVVDLIEEAACRFTAGNKTEAVALGLRRLLEQEERRGSLFGAHAGSVTVGAAVDLVEPVLKDVPEAETGDEIAR